MRQLKRLVRRFLAGALYYSGLLWVYAEFKLRNKAVVLTYHRVLPPVAYSFSHQGIVVTPATFACHMEFLSRHFSPLTAEQFRDSLFGPGFCRRACLVTFDDGWHDNVRNALPILERFAVPALAFVATAYVSSDKTFWQETLTRLLFTASKSTTAGHDTLRELGLHDVCMLDDDEARRTIRDVVTSLKRFDPAHVDTLIERLEFAVGRETPLALDRGEDRFMTWDDVRELAHSGLVSIGSHAHTHTPLPALGYSAAKAELVRSKQEIESHGHKQVWACAYPNGDVDDAAAAAVGDSGYALAFTTAHGHVRSEGDPIRLCRINIHESGSDTKAQFLCRMLGLF